MSTTVTASATEPTHNNDEPTSSNPINMPMDIEGSPEGTVPPRGRTQSPGTGTGTLREQTEGTLDENGQDTVTDQYGYIDERKLRHRERLSKSQSPSRHDKTKANHIQELRLEKAHIKLKLKGKLDKG